MLHLLSEIERNPSFTQRSLARELGIALGLMNQYLKRCVSTGWVRASQVSPRRITYFLTPDGLKEKARMVAGYLARSMTFFRDAKTQCQQLLNICQAQGWSAVALVGAGDLADIAKLVAQKMGIHVEVVALSSDLSIYDAIIITDVIHPQNTYDTLQPQIEYQRLLTPELLHITRVVR